MKKLTSVLILFAIASLLGISSCTGGDTAEPTADLEITVTDVSGKPQQDATVSIYKSFDDWITKTNKVGDTKRTDFDGKVLFEDLESAKYYWYVEKNCFNNTFGFSTTKNPIEAGKKSIVSTYIESTGMLKLINASNDIYRVYIDGEVADKSMEGGENRDFIAKEGTLLIRVVQQSGFTTTPIDSSFNVSIECGITTSSVFP